MSLTYEGNTHEKKICDVDPKEYDYGKIQVTLDTYQMELKYVCPRRNLKEKNLLLTKKLENKKISGIRIKVNNAIGVMKKKP